jgi:hypothetical protein
MKKTSYTLAIALLVGVISNPIFSFAASDFDSNLVSNKLDTAKTVLQDVRDMVGGDVKGVSDTRNGDLQTAANKLQSTDQRFQVIDLKLKVAQLLARLRGQLDLSLLEGDVQNLNDTADSVYNLVTTDDPDRPADGEDRQFQRIEQRLSWTTRARNLSEVASDIASGQKDTVDIMSDVPEDDLPYDPSNTLAEKAYVFRAHTSILGQFVDEDHGDYFDGQSNSEIMAVMNSFVDATKEARDDLLKAVRDEIENTANETTIEFEKDVVDSADKAYYNYNLGVKYKQTPDWAYDYTLEFQCDEDDIDIFQKVTGDITCNDPLEYKSNGSLESVRQAVEVTNTSNSSQEFEAVLTVTDNSTGREVGRDEDDVKILSNKALTAEVVDKTASTQMEESSGLEGAFKIIYEVTATGDDQLWTTHDYHLFDENGATYDLYDFDGKPNQSVSCDTESAAERWKGGSYIIREDQTEEITLTCDVTVSEDGYLGLRVDEINHKEYNDDGTNKTLQLTSEDEWETDLIQIDSEDDMKENITADPELRFADTTINSGEYLGYDMELGIDESDFGYYEIELKCEPGIEGLMKVYGNGCEEPIEIGSFTDGEFSNSSRFINNTDEKKEVGVVLTVYDKNGNRVTAAGDVSAVTVRPESKLTIKRESKQVKVGDTADFTISYPHSTRRLVIDTRCTGSPLEIKGKGGLMCGETTTLRSSQLEDGRENSENWPVEIDSMDGDNAKVAVSVTAYDDDGNKETQSASTIVTDDTSSQNMVVEMTPKRPKGNLVGAKADWNDLKGVGEYQATISRQDIYGSATNRRTVQDSQLSTGNFYSTGEDNGFCYAFDITIEAVSADGDVIAEDSASDCYMADRANEPGQHPNQRGTTDVKVTQPQSGADYEVGDTMEIRLDKSKTAENSPLIIKLSLSQGASSDTITTTKKERVSWDISAKNRLIEMLRGMARVAEKLSYYNDNSDYENEFQITVHNAETGKKIGESGEFEIFVPEVN